MSEFFDFAQANGFALVRLDRHKKFSTEPGWSAGWSKERANWEKWIAEGFNIGVHASASRLITFDLDSKHGGIEAVRQRFDAWCEASGMAPLPHHVETASSGQHVYMQVPDGVDPSALASNLSGKIGAGIDVLTGNRQSVAPGSYFDGTAESKPSGTYSFNDAPLYEAPPAVLKFCTPESRALESTPSQPSGYDQGDAGKILEYLTERDEFDGYEEWLRCGMALKAEFGDDGLALWALTHNATVTPDVIATKWNSFDSDAKAGAFTIRSLFDRAHKLGWKGTVRQSVATMFGGVAQLVTAPPMVPTAPAFPVPPTADQLVAERVAALDALPSLFRTSKQMVTGFAPPEYLIDGVLQRRYCYSHTAQTGVGKTAQDLRIAAHVATGQTLCGLEVQKGTVLYFCGENPTDVQMRWIGLTHEMELDPDSLDVHFTEEAHRITPEFIERVRREVIRNGQTIALVIVDTAAAHSPAEEENSNNQQGDYARLLRSFCTLPGGPCTLILCHPTKGAEKINEMIPRGGGSFLAEVDGNLGSVKNADGSIVTAAVGKFRGPEFPPLHFALKSVKDVPVLIDSRGKQVPTVVAEPISASEVVRREEKAVSDDIKVIQFIDTNPGKSLSDIATGIGWVGPSASIKSKVNRIVKRLTEAKPALVFRDPISGRLTLTGAAQKSLNGLESTVSYAVSPPPPYPVI